MTNLSSHCGQPSRKVIGLHGFATLVLMLCAPWISGVCLAQQAQSTSTNDRIGMNSHWGDAKISLALPPASRQEPAVSIAKVDPAATLRSARVISVRSTSLLVKAPTIEEKLRGRSEFKELQLVITRDESEADIVLEVEPDVLTKYVYTAIDPRTHTVVATGKVSSLFGTVAGKVAKRFLKQVARARR